MFGPTMSLKGNSDEAVKYAASHMMSEQIVVLKFALVGVTALFIGACLLSWANYETGIS